MKVWIVYEKDLWSSTPRFFTRAVFSSEGKAIDYIAGKNRPLHAEEWDVDDTEGDSH